MNPSMRKMKEGVEDREWIQKISMMLLLLDQDLVA